MILWQCSLILWHSALMPAHPEGCKLHPFSPGIIELKSCYQSMAA